MGVALVTSADFTVVRFITRVDVRMFLPVRTVGEPSVTAFELTLERFFTCVRPLVDLEVLAASEDLAAAGERARKGLLAGVHAYVVDELVLGLEGPAVPGAVVPEAGVVGALGSADVLHGDVGHDLVHGGERLVAQFLGTRLVLVHPLAAHLLLDGLAHVAEEGAGTVRSHVVVHRMVHRVVHVVVVELRIDQVVVAHGRRTHLVVVELVVGGGRARVHVRCPRRDARQPHLPVDVVRRVGRRVMRLVQTREQHVWTARVRVVQAGARRHEHAVVRSVARRQGLVRRRRRVGRERGRRHRVVLPPQSQKVPRPVTPNVAVVVVRMRHRHAVAVGGRLRAELVVGLRVSPVGSRRVPHGVRRAQLDGPHVSRGGRGRCRCVRRVDERVQHRGNFFFIFIIIRSPFSLPISLILSFYLNLYTASTAARTANTRI